MAAMLLIAIVIKSIAAMGRSYKDGHQMVPRWMAPSEDSKVTQAGAYTEGSLATRSFSSTKALARNGVRIGPGRSPATRTGEFASSACSMPTSDARPCCATP